MGDSGEIPPGCGDARRRAARWELPPGFRDVVARAQEFASSPAYQRAIEQAKDWAATWQRHFAEVVVPALEQWQLQLPAVEEWLRRHGPEIARWLEAARELWLAAIPPNWEGLEAEQVTAVIDRVRETGFCLVWLPRVEIVRAVIAAPPSDTGAILSARREDVLEDASALLLDVASTQVQNERMAAERAIAALRAGHVWPAQALAASTFTSAAHVWFEMGTKAIAKRMAEEPPEDADILELRLRTIFLAGNRALEEFRPDRARPTRSAFNRHNTAHRITPEQWTDQNALSAVMLAVALVRELDYWLSRRAAEKTSDSGAAGS